MLPSAPDFFSHGNASYHKECWDDLQRTIAETRRMLTARAQQVTVLVLVLGHMHVIASATSLYCLCINLLEKSASFLQYS